MCSGACSCPVSHLKRSGFSCGNTYKTHGQDIQAGQAWEGVSQASWAQVCQLWVLRGMTARLRGTWHPAHPAPQPRAPRQPLVCYVYGPSQYANTKSSQPYPPRPAQRPSGSAPPSSSSGCSPRPTAPSAGRAPGSRAAYSGTGACWQSMKTKCPSPRETASSSSLPSYPATALLRNMLLTIDGISASRI